MANTRRGRRSRRRGLSVRWKQRRNRSLSRWKCKANIVLPPCLPRTWTSRQPMISSICKHDVSARMLRGYQTLLDANLYHELAFCQISVRACVHYGVGATHSIGTNGAARLFVFLFALCALGGSLCRRE